MTTEEEFSKSVKKSSKSLTALWVAVAVLFLASAAVIAGLWVSFRKEKIGNNLASVNNTESGEVMGATTEDPDYLSNLVANLKTTGVIAYGFNSNAETKRQLAIFGQAISNLDYVECDSQVANSNPDECIARGISDYPTWVKGDQKFVGFKTLEDLEKILAAQ